MRFKNFHLLKEEESHLDKLKFKYNIDYFEKSNPSNSVNSIGFSKKDEKWFGFSHRAIHGHKIGDSVKIGDSAFFPSNKEEFKKKLKLDYKDKIYKNVKIKEEKNGLKIDYDINDIHCSNFMEYPDEWGKGEWTAKTIEDAKEMAKDFARSVS